MRTENSGKLGRAGLALVLAAALPALVQAADVRADADARARALVARMTMDEKTSQLLNVGPALPPGYSSL